MNKRNRVRELARALELAETRGIPEGKQPEFAARVMAEFERRWEREQVDYCARTLLNEAMGREWAPR